VRVKDGRESLISESRLKTLLEEKFHAGVEAGQKSLGEQLVQQRGELLQIQNGILRELHNSIPKLIQECEKDLVSLALETAQRVVGAIPISTEIVESAVREAVEEVKGSTEYEVRLNPEDLELLKRNQSGVLPANENKDITFAADPAVSRGGCLVQTRFGTIDALRETKFNRVKESALC